MKGLHLSGLGFLGFGNEENSMSSCVLAVWSKIFKLLGHNSALKFRIMSFNVAVITEVSDPLSNL